MINEYIEIVTSSLKTALASLVTDVEDHPGRFTETELSRIARSPRAVRVAIEDIAEIKVLPNKNVHATLRMAAFIICSDHAGPDRTKSAIELAEKVVSVLPRNRWDSEDYQIIAESTISAQNLYTGDIEKKGIAMWAVTWTQTIKGII